MKLDKLCKHCKKYNNCKEGYVQRFKDLTHTLYFCPKFLYNDGNPITNADRIRSMSDEELLNFICSIETYDEGSVKTIEGGSALCSVTDVEKWLQSEVEE